MQGKPAAGYNIRQSAVFIKKLIKIQIIIAYYKFNIDIRELFLMYGAYLSYRLVLHKYTVIVSASSFSALFPPQPDKSDMAVPITKSPASSLFHFFFFITTPSS